MFTLFIITTIFFWGGGAGAPFICLIGDNVKMKCFDPGRWTCLTQWDLLELLRASPVNFPYQLCASPLSRSLSLCSCALYLLTKALRKETGMSIRANAKEWKVGCSWKKRASASKYLIFKISRSQKVCHSSRTFPAAPLVAAAGQHRPTTSLLQLSF